MIFYIVSFSVYLDISFFIMSETLFVCLSVLYAAVSQRKISTPVDNKDLFYSILFYSKDNYKEMASNIELNEILK